MQDAAGPAAVAKLEATPADAGDSRPRLGWATKSLYASGSIGNGIKKAGLAGFLMIYYNQVVGLPATTVGAALSIALIVDAVIDPLVGQASDHLRSRWGRRHPFMYASIVPVSLAFALLWMAPVGWPEGQLAAYMLALVLIVRIFDTFFEIPAAALLAEMTRDYDERTAVLSMRYMFGTVGALVMKVLAYQVFLTPEGADTSGVLNREGFAEYGLTAGVVIFVTILAACVGTHRFIPYLHTPRRRTASLAAVLREAAATLGDRSWAALTAGGAALAIAKGAASGLALYLHVYFWGLKAAQISLLAVADLFASVAGALAAMHISRRLGKRNAAILALLIGFSAFALPIVLGLAHLMPPRRSTELLVTLFGASLVQEFFGMVAAVLISSMMVDLVEDSERRTGRRSEGLLMAADNLLQKAVAGAGVFISGLVLAAVHFPEHAKPGRVPREVVGALAKTLVMGMTPLYLLAAVLLCFYRLSRQDHEANLQGLSGGAR